MFKKKAGAEGTNEGTHAPTAALLGESQHVALGDPWYNNVQDFQDRGAVFALFFPTAGKQRMVHFVVFWKWTHAVFIDFSQWNLATRCF